jgi:hypothetical protein
MKRLLLVCLIFGTVAQAQEISCPKFYPFEDTVLGEVPYQHSGKGVLKRQELSGANWMAGDFNDTFGEMIGQSDKVKGGVDISVPSFAKWFVCWYGKGEAVAWWEELKPGANKAGTCKIQIRNKTGRDPMDIKLVCR